MSKRIEISVTVKELRFLIRACERAAPMLGDDPNDQWFYADLAKDLRDAYREKVSKPALDALAAEAQEMGEYD